MTDFGIGYVDQVKLCAIEGHDFSISSRCPKCGFQLRCAFCKQFLNIRKFSTHLYVKHRFGIMKAVGKLNENEN